MVPSEPKSTARRVWLIEMTMTSRAAVPVTVTVPWLSCAVGAVAAAPALLLRAVTPPTATASPATVRPTLRSPLFPREAVAFSLITAPVLRSLRPPPDAWPHTWYYGQQRPA